jgi:hypothetical protein
MKEITKYLYEFANLGSNRTGIKKLMIHVYSQGDKELLHAPRIKVSNIYEKFREKDCFVINILTLEIKEGEIKIKQKELSDLLKWIKLNRKALVNYWKVGTEISTDKFLDSLKKLNT